MITIISGSNRTNNKSISFANKYKEILISKGQECKLFSLTDLPETLTFNNLYNYNDSILKDIVEEYIIPAEKLVFVIPEYNGSFPGVLKTFIDANHPKNYKGKIAAIVGIASGRAGNLRGMDHFTAVLHHLQVEVVFNKLPISQIDSLINTNNELVDVSTIELLEQQADQLINRSFV